MQEYAERHSNFYFIFERFHTALVERLTCKYLEMMNDTDKLAKECYGDEKYVPKEYSENVKHVLRNTCVNDFINENGKVLSIRPEPWYLFVILRPEQLH